MFEVRIWNRSSAWRPEEWAFLNAACTAALEKNLRQLEPSLEGLTPDERKTVLSAFDAKFNENIAQVVREIQEFGLKCVLLTAAKEQ